MFVSPVDVEVRREHYQDLVREAEHERLAQLALQSMSARESLARRLSRRTRDLLFHWTCRLAPANTFSACSRYV